MSRAPGLAVLALAALAGCGGPATGVPGGGTCPSPDPVRDGPLVDAIRLETPAPVAAILARDPSDIRARAALDIISGARPDRDQAACFAPYLQGPI